MEEEEQTQERGEQALDFIGWQPVIEITVSIPDQSPSANNLETFTIHKHVLARHSLLFRRTFEAQELARAQGQTSTTQNQNTNAEFEFEINTIAPSRFATITNWLYNRVLLSPNGDKITNILALAEIWKGAEYLEITGLQRELVQSMEILCTEKNVSMSELGMFWNLVYFYEGGENALAEMAVRSFLKMEKGDFGYMFELLPQKMAVDVLSALKDAYDDAAVIKM